MNEFIYLQFELPIELEVQHKNRLRKSLWSVVRTLFSSLVANPDYEDILHEVQTWKVEHSISESCTTRELGYDRHGKLVVALPDKRNYGYWLDIVRRVEDYDTFSPERIDKEEFENEWTRFFKQRSENID